MQDVLKCFRSLPGRENFIEDCFKKSGLPDDPRMRDIYASLGDFSDEFDIQKEQYEPKNNWDPKDSNDCAAILGIETMAKRMGMTSDNWPSSQCGELAEPLVKLAADLTVKKEIKEALQNESFYILTILSNLLSDKVKMENTIRLHVSDELKTVLDVPDTFEKLKSELEGVLEELKKKHDDEDKICEFLIVLRDALQALYDEMQGYDDKSYIRNRENIRGRALKALDVERKRPCETCPDREQCKLFKINQSWIIPLIRKIKNKVTFRAGEYCDATKTITLFRSVLGEYDDRSNYAEWLGTFAHELFHAFHFEQSEPIKDKKDWNKWDEVLIESLAAFFEDTYCKNAGFYMDQGEFDRISGYLKKSWDLEDLWDWPYSGAKALTEETFRDVFLKSKANSDEAIVMLLRL